MESLLGFIFLNWGSDRQERRLKREGWRLERGGWRREEGGGRREAVNVDRRL
jgi:hypothetical protein